MLPQGHEIPSIFGPSAPTMRELHVSLNYPDTNVKKRYAVKTSTCGTVQGLIGKRG